MEGGTTHDHQKLLWVASVVVHEKDNNIQVTIRIQEGNGVPNSGLGGRIEQGLPGKLIIWDRDPGIIYGIFAAGFEYS